MSSTAKPSIKITREQLIKRLLTPCKTRDELYKFVSYFFEMQLPDVTVSRFADINPFDMVWMVYDICVNKNNPGDIKDILFCASRGGGKTLGAAIVELLLMLHDQRDVGHVGAVMSQAKRCYDYQVKFMLNPIIKPLIDPPKVKEEDKILQKMNMEKSVFKFNSQYVSIEVLPCTLKACNGLHTPFVCTDEIDTVSGEGLKAYREISGMLDSRGDKKALRIGISTRKSRYGLMNAQMENAEKEGRTVYKWTALEFSERCPDSRSGTTPIVAYTIIDALEAISEEEWKRKDPKKQKEYERHVLPGENCLRCPAAACCLGDAKKQSSKSPMLKPIDEYIQKIRSEGADWSLAQLMNLKPSVEGIIYKEFEEKLHVKNWNELWHKLTGTEFPGECTHDMFVKKCHQLGLPCYGAIDWGWKNPNTVVYLFVDKTDNVYVVRSDGLTFVSQPEWIHYIKHKWHLTYRCQLYFPDIADMGAVVEMRKAGLPTVSEIDKSINTGIQIIKSKLRVPGSPEPKIFFAKETCGSIIDEFKMYHFKTASDGTISDVPEEEFDHWLDALRYCMTSIFGKTVLLSSQEDTSFNKAADNQGNFYGMPSVTAFAASKGINLNTEVNNQHLIGKIGTIKEFMDEEDADNEIKGDGGFLWSC